MRSWPRFGPWLSAAVLPLATQGISQSIPSPNLNVNNLGQVALAGDFDAISLYSYAGQTEGFNSNGTQSVISQVQNGLYKRIASTDADIMAMCPFVLRNGTLVGLIVAGNFTSIGGVDARSIALINPGTQTISAHVGIQGTVNALLCDQDTETVYVGGSFEASVSTNAIAWVASGAWANLPFEGFDGPVTTITKAPNGHVIFGGSFTGLGNGSVTASTTTADSSHDTQVINLVSANITSVANTTSGQGITCPPTSSTTPWLLQDNTAGSWEASMGFGYQPTKLRLWNANQNGRGTKTWRMTALPLNGIMNMSYTDPATGQIAYCDATCPLSPATSSSSYQDFYLVNPVGMNAFRIDVSAWYGSGGGLNGVQLFSDQIYTYAIESFNEPSCSGSQTTSRVTTTGAWYEVPSRDSYSDYLSVVTGPTTVGTTQIVFQPDVKDDGNYTVMLYTPGCIQDSSCSARAIVNVTGTLTSNGGISFSELIYQTNNYDKYDPVYTGPIAASTGSFRPSVTIRPSGFQTDQLVVASKIRFALVNSTGGLNGLFDYDPNLAVVDTDFSKSAINSVGTKLRSKARVVALATQDNTIYAAGQFGDDVLENILAFSNNTAISLPGAGLNSAVASIYAGSNYLFVGGNFTGTVKNSTTGLNNVAAYRYSDKTWVALGAGVDGAVNSVSPLPLNISGTATETCIAVSGSFNNILATTSASSVAAKGFAVWVPSRNAWLEQLNVANKQMYAGQLNTYTILPNGTWIGAGTLTSLGQSVSGVVELLPAASGNVRLTNIPIQISSTASSSSSMSKRALIGSQNVTGVVTGAYYDPNGKNISVYAGHFTATANSSTIQNLVFLSGTTATGLPTGIDSNSTFLTLALQNNLLVAGGSVTGKVGSTQINGLVMYDMSLAAFRNIQPAALVGNNVVVNSITDQPSSSAIYVGGSFDSTTQGLSCRSVCMYDTSTNQWNTVGGQLSGSVTALYWTSSTMLLAAGNLTVSGNSSSLARYDSKQQAWSTQSSPDLPGPITAFAAGTSNADHIWVSGTAKNGSTYLIEIDGTNVRPVPGGFESGTTIRSLRVVDLSSSHGSSQYLDRDQALLITGSLNLTGFGRASAALFNGSTFTPFILSSTSNGNAGSVSQLISSAGNTPRAGGRHHSRGITVLVALCAALGTIFLIVLVGILVNLIQRKRKGYSAVPSVPYTDKASNIARVPPNQLFGSLGQKQPGAPYV